MEGRGFHVDLSYVDDRAVLTVRGELDADTAAGLQAAFDRLDPARSAVALMSDVGFMDSSGLRLVLETATAMFEAGGSLRIRDASSAVRRLLKSPSSMVSSNDPTSGRTDRPSKLHRRTVLRL